LEELDDLYLSREAAIVSILRSRLANSAPLNTEQLAQSLAISLTETETALLQLENEGYVLRGNWSDKPSQETDHQSIENQTDTMPEWCERSLLNNSHRNSIHNSRKTVQSVSSADFFCFLFDWQHLTPQHHYRGAQTLNLILEQLQGYQAPISLWQKDIINNRITDISDLMFWLDALISSGQYLWLRLDNATSSQKLTHNTPITFIPRQALNHWQNITANNQTPQSTASAQLLLDILQEKGALFYDELQTRSGFLKSQLDAALGELIALGLISCDLFSGLTRLFSKPVSRHKKSAIPLPSGRWSIIQPTNIQIESNSMESDAALTCLAHSLLRRYGVIFKSLLSRETCHNQWQQLLPILQRMEWSGEIRCGRFVSGQYGQQFALPEAVQQLNKTRATDSNSETIIINATDPLNLIGILTSDDKISAYPGNRILFKQGKAIAYLTGKEVIFLENIKQEKHWEIKRSLIRKTGNTSKQSTLSH
jgi:ATP-dependent Lhr-like helicase